MLLMLSWARTLSIAISGKNDGGLVGEMVVVIDCTISENDFGILGCIAMALAGINSAFSHVDSIEISTPRRIRTTGRGEIRHYIKKVRLKFRALISCPGEWHLALKRDHDTS